jgi:hypothetical protein
MDECCAGIVAKPWHVGSRSRDERKAQRFQRVTALQQDRMPRTAALEIISVTEVLAGAFFMS